MAVDEPTDAERYAREQAFHDDRFADDDRPANRFYEVAGSSERHYFSLVDSLETSRSVLDYGCGADARTAIRLARAGHRVTAIDISPVAIEHATEQARLAGVEDRITFRTMNAEVLDLESESFGAVVGAGVLHHLDLERSYGEIARVLTPDGRAIFSEPLGHNPVINLYRDRTPEQRTPDEHPFTTADIELARRFFTTVETRSFVVTSLALVPFGRARRSQTAVDSLDRVDAWLMRRFPGLAKYAWLMVLDMRLPLS